MNVAGTPVLYIGVEARVKAQQYCTLLGWLNVEAAPDTAFGLLSLELKIKANGLPLFDCSAFWRNLAMPLATSKNKSGLLQWNGKTYRIRGIQGTMGLNEFLDLTTEIPGLKDQARLTSFLDGAGTALELYADTNAGTNEPVYVRAVWFMDYAK